MATVIFVVALLVRVQGARQRASLALSVFILLLYIPMGYYTDLFMYRRRQAKKLRQQGEGLMDVRMFTVGPVAENCFLVRQDGSSEAADRRPGRGGAEAPRRDRGARPRPAGDPAHPHPLRPRRRGRAGREGHRRARVLPEARGAGPAGHHELRPVAGLRPVRVLGPRGDRRGRRAAAARGLRHRRDLHARPQPRPRHLRRRGRAVQRRRPVRGLGRPHRPARRRLADARRARSSRCWTATPTSSASSRATWA